MKKKELAETLAELLADVPGNYEELTNVISAQQQQLAEIRDAAQDSLTWLGALRTAIQNVKLKSLDKK